MHRIDGPGHVNNLFVNEDALISRPGTDVTPEWLNAQQEELASLVEFAGLVLDKLDNTQVRQALIKIFPQWGVLDSLITAAGIVVDHNNPAQVLTAVQALIEARAGDFVLDTGAANAYVVALNPAINAYSGNFDFSMKVLHAPTGACTVDCGGGIVPLVNDQGGAIALNDFSAGSVLRCQYVHADGKVYITSMVQSQALTPMQADGRYSLYVGDAGGSANALTATVSTPIAALYDGMLVTVDAASANTISALTFNLTLGTTATGVKTITKLNGAACSPQDIAGSGHRLILGYAAATDTWLLCNPALGALANAAPVIATSGTVTTNNASATTGTFVAPSKGKLVIYGLGSSLGTSPSGVILTASLGALTSSTANIASNTNACVLGTISMNSGQSTTITMTFTSSDTGAKWAAVQAFFLPSA